MAMTIHTVEYYALRMPHRAGRGAELLGMLREAGVNLLAFHAFPERGRAQVDVVPEDPKAFLRAAKAAGVKPGRSKKAFLVQGDDRIGAVHEVVAPLAAAGINVHAGTALSAGDGRWAAILWVRSADVRRAARALGARAR